MATCLRPELEQLPPKMRALPVDARGYPVPWFVQWFWKSDQKPFHGDPAPDLHYPDHRIVDNQKFRPAIKRRLCWTCGTVMGRHLAFVIGPMCAVNRITAEPPNHLECAQFSARNCPFLSRPQAVRREAGMPETTPGAGWMILRNPGVALVYVTRGFELQPDHKGDALIGLEKPTAVYCYAQGRPATREEVMHSIDTGMPLLREQAKYRAEFVGGETVKTLNEESVIADNLAYLEKSRADLMTLLPR